MASGGNMTIALIGTLIALAGYLAIRLQSTQAENVALRASVASLKRQLGKHRS
jgi:hypothetical protein